MGDAHGVQSEIERLLLESVLLLMPYCKIGRWRRVLDDHGGVGQMEVDEGWFANGGDLATAASGETPWWKNTLMTPTPS